MSPPEFSIICRTHGGPATYVHWALLSQNNIDREESQLIVDTSHNSVYRNELRVRGRYSGMYTCIISNNMQEYFPMVTANLQAVIDISGKQIIACAHLCDDYLICQLLVSPLILLLSPTVHMSLCLGSHQVVLSLAM